MGSAPFATPVPAYKYRLWPPAPSRSRAVLVAGTVGDRQNKLLFSLPNRGDTCLKSPKSMSNSPVSYSRCFIGMISKGTGTGCAELSMVSDPGSSNGPNGSESRPRAITVSGTCFQLIRSAKSLRKLSLFPLIVPWVPTTRRLLPRMMKGGNFYTGMMAGIGPNRILTPKRG